MNHARNLLPMSEAIIETMKGSTRGKAHLFANEILARGGTIDKITDHQNSIVTDHRDQATKIDFSFMMTLMDSPETTKVEFSLEFQPDTITLYSVVTDLVIMSVADWKRDWKRLIPRAGQEYAGRRVVA